MQPHPTLYFRLARAAGVLCLLAALILPPAGVDARPFAADETPVPSETEAVTEAVTVTPLPTEPAPPEETGTPPASDPPPSSSPEPPPAGTPAPTVDPLPADEPAPEDEPSPTPVPDGLPFAGDPTLTGEPVPSGPEGKAERYIQWNQRPLPAADAEIDVDRDQPDPQAAQGYCNTVSVEYWTTVVYMVMQAGDWEIAQSRLCFPTNGQVLLTNNGVDDYYPRLNNAQTEIVFVSERAGNPEIYTMRPDGTNVRRLTNHPAADSQPRWSPDGKQIVFTSDREGSADIYVINRDGSGLKRLTTSPDAEFQPDWSPSGKEIAYARAVNINGRIYRMNADGTKQVPITDPMTYPENPVWSPTGDWIAFDYFSIYHGVSSLVTVRRDGSERVGRGAVENWDEVRPSSWSEDGKIIYYTFLDFDPYSGYLIESGFWLVLIDQPSTKYQLSYGRIEMNPDVHRLDMQPPVVKITQPLPTQTLASGWIYLPFRIEDIGPSGVDPATIKLTARQEFSASYIKYKFSSPGADGAWIYPEYVEYGKVYEICIHARDNSLNTMTCPAGGHMRTSFYGQTFTGQVTDNRGAGLPGASIIPGPVSPIDPPTVGTSGGFNMRYSERGVYSSTFTRPGFAPQPVSYHLNVEKFTFRRQNIPLLPVGPGQPQQWQFNDPSTALDGWQVSGTVQTSSQGQNVNGLRLGAGCSSADCLAAPGSLIPYSFIEQGPDGAIHMVWNRSYRKRTPQGVWQPLEALPLYGDYLVEALTVDPAGSPHVLVKGYGTRIGYLHHDASGAWVMEHASICSGPAQIAVDGKGQVHVMCLNTYNNTINYIRRASTGGWVHKGELSYANGTPCWFYPGRFGRATGPFFRIAVRPDGTAFLAFIENLLGSNSHPDVSINRLWVFTYDPDGKVAARERFETPFDPQGQLAMGMDSAGRLRLLLFQNVDIQREGLAQLFTREPGGSWKPPEFFYTYSDFLVDPRLVQFFPDGTIYISEYANFIRRSPSDGSVAKFKYHVPDTDQMSVQTFIDRSGQPHFFNKTAQGNFYRTLRTESQAGETTLSRVIAIPAEMNAPTLSFFYRRAPAYPLGAPRLEIIITPAEGDPVTMTVQPASDTWRLGWVDLTPWTGQVVTVTFRLRHNAGDPVVQLDLDEIALASYLVPGITSLAPARLELPLAPGAQVTLRGTGFMEGAAVTIGGQPVTVLSRPDSTTLVVEVPAGLEPGLYDVVVTNPGGYASPGPVRLGVGLPVFVPVIRR